MTEPVRHWSDCALYGLTPEPCDCGGFIDESAGPAAILGALPSAREGEAGRPAPWGQGPSRLWSLWDMLKESAEAFIQLGEYIHDARLIFEDPANFEQDVPGERVLSSLGREEMRTELTRVLAMAERLDLSISKRQIGRRIAGRSGYPQTRDAFEGIVETIKDELETRLFFFVLPHRAKYFDRPLPASVSAAFASAGRELDQAGRSVAFGLFTASVFHSMRAAEIGVQAMGTALGTTFPHPIEFAGWGAILGEIKKKLAAMEQQPKTAQRDEDLAFYSDAASQFRHFNNAWRVRIAHARASADEDDAVRVLDHTTEFLTTLSSRLQENQVA